MFIQTSQEEHRTERFLTRQLSTGESVLCKVFWSLMNISFDKCFLLHILLLPPTSCNNYPQARSINLIVAAKNWSKKHFFENKHYTFFFNNLLMRLENIFHIFIVVENNPLSAVSPLTFSHYGHYAREKYHAWRFFFSHFLSSVIDNVSEPLGRRSPPRRNFFGRPLRAPSATSCVMCAFFFTRIHMYMRSDKSVSMCPFGQNWIIGQILVIRKPILSQPVSLKRGENIINIGADTFRVRDLMPEIIRVTDDMWVCWYAPCTYIIGQIRCVSAVKIFHRFWIVKWPDISIAGTDFIETGLIGKRKKNKKYWTWHIWRQRHFDSDNSSLDFVADEKGRCCG